MWISENPHLVKDLQYITLSGTGEPTLNIKAGQLIAEIKKLTSVPVAVISNASLFCDPQVRKELLGADLIVPSLDAATDKVFLRVDRPMLPLKTEDIINGIAALKKEYRGKLWLEVMLVKGLNDDLRHIRRLKEAIDRINPDKIQLNSPVRTTAECNVSSVLKPKLNKIKQILGDKCEVI